MLHVYVLKALSGVGAASLAFSDIKTDLKPAQADLDQLKKFVAVGG